MTTDGARAHAVEAAEAEHDSGTGRPEMHAVTPTDGVPAPPRAGLVAQAIVRAVPVYVVSRLFAFAAIGVGTKIFTGLTMKNAFLVWDAGWYVGTAAGGYPQRIPEVNGLAQQSTIAFFPGYPLAVRAFRAVTGQSVLVSAVVVSILAGAVAAVLLWILVRRLYDRRVADRTVALFAFFPSSLAMLLPFAEGLMLVFVIGCLLALLDRRWLLAGVLAACATATRPNAIVVGACCAWEAAVAIRRNREWRALAAPVLAPMGIVAYFVFLKFHTGEFGAWMRVEEEGWGYSGAKLGVATWRALTVAIHDPLYDLNYVTSTASLLFAVVGLALLLKWRAPASLTILAVGVSLLALGTGLAPASRPRYMLGAFPFMIALAKWANNERRYAMLIGGSAALFGTFVILTTGTPHVVF